MVELESLTDQTTDHALAAQTRLPPPSSASSPDPHQTGGTRSAASVPPPGPVSPGSYFHRDPFARFNPAPQATVPSLSPHARMQVLRRLYATLTAGDPPLGLGEPVTVVDEGPRLVDRVPGVSPDLSHPPAQNGAVDHDWEMCSPQDAVTSPTLLDARSQVEISSNRNSVEPIAERRGTPVTGPDDDAMDVVEPEPRSDQDTTEPATSPRAENRPDRDPAANIDGDVDADADTENGAFANIPQPRAYQLELYQHAVRENVIAVMPTGSGKTLVAVLLIRHMCSVEKERQEQAASNGGRLYRPRKAFFVVNKVHLAIQQASVIKKHTALRVELIHGDVAESWGAKEWWRMQAKTDVVVSTSQIVLDALRSGYVRLSEICVMVFDEVHDAVGRHPMRLIMTNFYHAAPKLARPKVFCMTASPSNAKGNVQMRMMALEETMDASVFQVDDAHDELEQHAPRAETQFVMFREPTPAAQVGPIYLAIHDDAMRIAPNLFNRTLFNEYPHIAAECGVCVAERYLLQVLHEFVQPIQRLQQAGRSAHVVVDPALLPAIQELNARARATGAPLPITMATVSQKVRSLFLDVLAPAVSVTTGAHVHFRGIVFAERRLLVRILRDLLDHFLRDEDARLAPLTTECITGHSGSAWTALARGMEVEHQTKVIDDFRAGKINLLFSTQVAEEGLDIPACNTVIRFSLPKTVISLIQSRGRARHRSSKYVVMINANNPDEIRLMADLRDQEQKLAEANTNMSRPDQDDALHADPKEAVHLYKVKSTGATLTLQQAVPLLAQFCATLPGNEFYRPQPRYLLQDSERNTEWHRSRSSRLRHLDFAAVIDPALDKRARLVAAKAPPTRGEPGCRCILFLPESVRLETKVLERTAPSKQLARQLVAFDACVRLHKAGLLDGNLRPISQVRPPKGVVRRFYDAHSKVHTSTRTYAAPFAESIRTSVDEAPDSTYSAYLSIFLPSSDTDEDDASDRLAPLFGNMARVGVLTRHPMDAVRVTIAAGWTCQPIGTPTVLQLTRSEMDLVDKFMVRVLSGTWVQNWAQSPPEPTPPMACYLVPLVHSLELSHANIDWDLMRVYTETDWNTVRGDAVVDMVVGVFREQHRARCVLVADRADKMRPMQVLRVHAPGSVPESALQPANDVQTHKTSNVLSLAMQHPTTILECRLVPRCSKGKSKSDAHRIVPTDGSMDNVRVFLPDTPARVAWIPVPAHVYGSLRAISEAIYHVDEIMTLRATQARLDIPCTLERFRQALTLPSSARTPNYESLEFLGDTVLQVFTTAYTFVKNPDGHEGVLCANRMTLTVNTLLCDISECWRFHEAVVAHAYRPRDWRDWLQFKPKPLTTSDKMRADLIEALLGAVYTDAGLEAAYSTLLKFMTTMADEFPTSASLWDAVGALYQNGNMDHGAAAIANDSDAADDDEPVFFGQFTSTSAVSAPDRPPVDVAAVSAILGHRFRNPNLAVQALTHPSYLLAPSYQRLEWLGDALLQYAVVKRLMTRWPTASPVLLHRMQSVACNNMFLGLVCVHMGLHRHVASMHPHLGRVVAKFEADLIDLGITRENPVGSGNNYARCGGLWERLSPPKALGDVVEALFAAVWIDSGCEMDAVTRLHDRLFAPYLEHYVTPDTYARNPLSYIYEVVAQKRCSGLRLENVATASPSPAAARPTPSFLAFGTVGTDAVLDPDTSLTYRAALHGHEIGRGTADTSQAAKIRAAQAALATLDGKTMEFWDEIGCDCPVRLRYVESMCAKQKDDAMDVDVDADAARGNRTGRVSAAPVETGDERDDATGTEDDASDAEEPCNPDLLVPAAAMERFGYGADVGASLMARGASSPETTK
ncbi:Dicer-like protein 1 [Allomyces arbusculus]|nr:Dicer-like protein 1 [Allomyces arbusculus]